MAVAGPTPFRRGPGGLGDPKFASRLRTTVLLVVVLALHTCSAKPSVQDGPRGPDPEGNTVHLQEILAAGPDSKGVRLKLDRHNELHGLGALETDGGRDIDAEEYGATFYMIIEPYEDYCFFQPTKKGTELHVLFHVETKARVQFPDLDMEVTDPAGDVVLRELRSMGNYQDGDHEKEFNLGEHDGANIRTKRSGDYKICFSNKQSSSAHQRKTLFVDIGPVLNIRYKTLKDQIPAALSESMHKSLEVCIEALDGVMEIQMMQRRLNKRDLGLAEQNSDIVNYRSMLTITLMFVVVALQTFFIRKLFYTPSRQ